MAMCSRPSVPQPYTNTVPLLGGGLCKVACNDTEKGSASTAAASEMSSGMGMHCDSCAGTREGKPPVASLLLPSWMPGASAPRTKLAHCAYSPRSHHAHSGVMPRGAHD